MMKTPMLSRDFLILLRSPGLIKPVKSSPTAQVVPTEEEH